MCVLVGLLLDEHLLNETMVVRASTATATTTTAMQQRRGEQWINRRRFIHSHRHVQRKPTKPTKPNQTNANQTKPTKPLTQTEGRVVPTDEVLERRLACSCSIFSACSSTILLSLYECASEQASARH